MRRNRWIRRGLLLLMTGLGWLGANAGEPADVFLQACRERAAAETAMTVAGDDGILFLRPELRHVGVGAFWGDAAVAVSRARKEKEADPLAAILDYQAQCEALGIRLILVPVPPKAVIHPEALAPVPVARYDLQHQAFYALLRERGVTVLDLTERFLQARAAGGPALYCRQDSHWSGTGCVVAAEELAALVNAQPWYADITRRAYTATPETLNMTGDLVRGLEPAPAAEAIALRRITLDGEALADDSASPVLLLGDSHTLVFHAGGDMHATGAGLADQLAYTLGMPIDVLGVRGSGARPARIALYKRAKAADYIAGKKLIIWCFAAREFTEADGWGTVPITK